MLWRPLNPGWLIPWGGNFAIHRVWQRQDLCGPCWAVSVFAFCDQRRFGHPQPWRETRPARGGVDRLPNRGVWQKGCRGPSCVGSEDSCDASEWENPKGSELVEKMGRFRGQERRCLPPMSRSLPRASNSYPQVFSWLVHLQWRWGGYPGDFATWPLNAFFGSNNPKTLRSHVRQGRWWRWGEAQKACLGPLKTFAGASSWILGPPT